MDIGLIVATTKDFVIGYKNNMPWNIPADLNIFKNYTTNNIVIMGRKTYNSIGKLLPNRINIVISKKLKSNLHFDNKIKFEDLTKILFVAQNLDDAIIFSKKLKSFFKEKEIFIIGGGEIYKEALEKNICTKLFISHIKNIYYGDTYINIDFNNYIEYGKEEYEDFNFIIYLNK